jgi:membrane-associated protein
MIELFEHLIHHDFNWVFTHYGTTIYSVLFLIIFVETGLVFMPFLPGDSLLFAAGLFAHLGNLNITYVIVLLFIAAVVGDNVNYWVGRTIGLKILKLKLRGKSLVKEEYLNKTHGFYEKYGTSAIIIARFAPIVRTVAPFVAGIAEMNYRRFLSFDILGGALWITSITLLGYFLGGFEWIQQNLEKVSLLIIFISILPMIIGILKAKFSKQKV